MKDINTKKTSHAPKVRELAARMPKELVRDVSIKSAVEQRNHVSADSSSKNPTQYAGDQLEAGIRGGADKSVRAVRLAGRYAVAKIKTKRAGEKIQQEAETAETAASEGTSASENGILSDSSSVTNPNISDGKTSNHRVVAPEANVDTLREKEHGRRRNLKPVARDSVRRNIPGEAKAKASKQKIKGYNFSQQATMLHTRQKGAAFDGGKQLMLGKYRTARQRRGSIKAVFSGIKAAVQAAVQAMKSTPMLLAAGCVVLFLVVI